MLDTPHGHGNFGERQRASDKDWGYYAHLSIYEFARPLARGKRFLDVGCGTGYGSKYILNSGAAAVTAFERDAVLVDSLARTHQNISFLQCDLDDGIFPLRDHSIQVAFSSNVLEHVAYPTPVISEIHRVLLPDGVCVIAIPPVSTIGMLKDNAKNIFHINNLPPEVWKSKLERFFHSVTPHRHWVVPSQSSDGIALDHSARTVSDFIFPECAAPSDFIHTITSVFVCRGPRKEALPELHEVSVPNEWKHLRVEADGRQEAFFELSEKAERLESELKRHIDIVHSSDDYWRTEMKNLYDFTKVHLAHRPDDPALLGIVNFTKNFLK